MGQHNSTQFSAQPQTGKEQLQQKQPPPRPHTLPQVPKIPNYAIPENRVIPEAPEFFNKRLFLRPVSKELKKIHPDFAEIFQYSEIPKDEQQCGNNLESGLPDESTGWHCENKDSVCYPNGNTARLPNNSNIYHRRQYSEPPCKPNNTELSPRKPNNTELSSAKGSQETDLKENISNKKVLQQIGVVNKIPVDASSENNRSTFREQMYNENTTNSLDRKTSKSVNAFGHKRFPSSTTSLINEQSVIPEDPREHLYSSWRKDPFSNSLPSGISLPQKNSFDLDYSLNLTYAQLTEFRRQRRMADMGDEKGRKFSELNCELAGKAFLPASPFDRNHLQASQNSASSYGSGTSKKRRAPAPPTASHHPDALQRDVSPDGDSPADNDDNDDNDDYDVKSESSPSMQRHNSIVSRTSTNSKARAPKPPISSTPVSSLVSIVPSSTSAVPASTSAVPSSTSAVPSSTSAVPSSTSAVPSSTSAMPSSTSVGNRLEKLSCEQQAHPGSMPYISADSARVIALAKAELEALKQLDKKLKEKENTSMSYISSDNISSKKDSTCEIDADKMACETVGEIADKMANEIDHKMADEMADKMANEIDHKMADKVAIEMNDEMAGKISPTMYVNVSHDVGPDIQNSASQDMVTGTPLSVSQTDEDGKTHAAHYSKTSHFTLSTSADEVRTNLNTTNPETEIHARNVPHRLNSLFQRDSVLATQSQNANVLVKTGTPKHYERPRDVHDIFKEELAKNADAREKRQQMLASVHSAGKPLAYGEEKRETIVQSFNPVNNSPEVLHKSDDIASQCNSSPKALHKTDDIASQCNPAAVHTLHKTDDIASQCNPAAVHTLHKTDDIASQCNPAGLQITPLRVDHTNTGKLNNESFPSKTSLFSFPSQTDKGKSESNPWAVSNVSDVSGRYTARPRQRIVTDCEQRDTICIPNVSCTSLDGIINISDDEDDCVEANNLLPNAYESSALRQFPEDWKPEDDLGSDDDMREDLAYSRTSAVFNTSGFKSTIIPGKLNDFKNAKIKLNPEFDPIPIKASSPTDEQLRSQSLEKLKKGVQEGVKNVLGSISRTSEKMRRTKSQDLVIQDNFKLKVLANNPASMANGEEHLKSDTQDAVLNGKYSKLNGSDARVSSDESSSPRHTPQLRAENYDIQKLKRAGVAYVSRNGQIVVLPEYETVRMDNKGNIIEEKNSSRAPRIFREKKKFMYDSTLRVKEKGHISERVASEVKVKERQIEAERRKQQDMEREFQRLRDVETLERLQRMQTLQFQQHSNLLQLQQHSNSSVPSHVIRSTTGQPDQQERYVVSELVPQHTNSNPLPGGWAGLASHRTVTPPVTFSSCSIQQLPYVTPTSRGFAGDYDVNCLDNYMRTVGVQPPSTPNQWTYLLNGVRYVGALPVTASSKDQGHFPESSGIHQSFLYAPPTAASYDATSSVTAAQMKTLENILMSGNYSVQEVTSNTGNPVASALAVQMAASTPSRLEQIQSGNMNTAIVPTMYLTDMFNQPRIVPAISLAGIYNNQNDDPLSQDINMQRDNPVYFSSDEEEDTYFPSDQSKQSTDNTTVVRITARTQVHNTADQPTIFHNLDETGVTCVQVPDVRDSNRDLAYNTFVNGESVSRNISEFTGLANSLVGNDSSWKTQNAPGPLAVRDPAPVPVGISRFSTKVYGPMGYRPVSFFPTSQRTLLQ